MNLYVVFTELLPLTLYQIGHCPIWYFHFQIGFTKLYIVKSGVTLFPLAWPLWVAAARFCAIESLGNFLTKKHPRPAPGSSPKNLG